MNPITKGLARTTPTPLFCCRTTKLGENMKWGAAHFIFHPIRSSLFQPARSTQDCVSAPVTAVASDVTSSAAPLSSHHENEPVEVNLEKVIYGCRFFAILAVCGSLIGSALCFFKGCVYVVSAFRDYFLDRGNTIAGLIEATDVYLLGTVMLVFGMGLYELFISNLDKAKSSPDGRMTNRSNLFGMFTLKERPRWLEIKTVNELKTKVGHVIVMLLLIGLFDKSKKAVIQSPLDLLCFSAAVLLSSGCLFLLSKLNE